MTLHPFRLLLTVAMRDSQTLFAKDVLLYMVLHHARCQSNVLSFKDLDKDKTALAVWDDKKTVKRRVYRNWPRDPKGRHILPENSCPGKMTSNGIQFWGATLWDFFSVYRFPDLEQLMSVSTGSKLAKWMIENNETDHAASEIYWAQQEPDPCQITPYPISGVIEDRERKIRLGICGKSMLLDASIDEEKTSVAVCL